MRRVKKGRTIQLIADGGHLTDKLIPTEPYSKLLTELTSGADFYSVLLDRWSVNFRSSEFQEKEVAFDNLRFDGVSIDPVIVRASNVRIIISMPDKGLARVDLTQRRYEIWRKSSQLEIALEKFDEGLRKAGAWPLLVPKSLAWLAAWPVFLLVPGLLAASIIVGTVDYFQPGFIPDPHPPGSPPAELSPLAVTILITFGATWICTAFVAVVLAIARKVIGGAVGQLPPTISGRGLIRAVARLRVNSLTRETSKSVIIAVASAVTTALVFLLLFGKDPSS